MVIDQAIIYILDSSHPSAAFSPPAFAEFPAQLVGHITEVTEQIYSHTGRNGGKICIAKNAMKFLQYPNLLHLLLMS
jgi:hypothetical protein